MRLSRKTLKNIKSSKVVVPGESLFELPEKVLQFGTGVLLRGLPDYFIDKANRQGIFNGRIVVVKSTTQGDTTAFNTQNGLYTLCVRGLTQGEKTEENIVNSSVSRVLRAVDDWARVLECAHNSNMQVIISNTTETGIQLVHDDIRRHPPVSFPGKLLAFLYERFQAFGGSEHCGMVIVPTELIPDNGRKLKSIVLELAHLIGLEEAFITWLATRNYFCNSLVDRIVPGKPDAATMHQLEEELGYEDQLLIMSEVYRLWAIEGNAHVKQILSFASGDEGMVIEPDIEKYRELKLRLLNGTHTLSCGVAFLAGLETVKQAMDDFSVFNFIEGLMLDEIVPSIPYQLSLEDALDFGHKVLDRFWNPHIKHKWISITMNYSSKMKMRCVPVLLRHYQNKAEVPRYIAFGFAAYIFFMKPVVKKESQYFGEFQDTTYLIQDDQAEKFYKRWAGLSTASLVQEVLRDTVYWEEKLYELEGFQEAITEDLNLIIEHGMKEALEIVQSKKNVV